jgi:hypothetical protein
MSLFFYGVFMLGVVLGGLVLLVLYSLLAMAQKGDELLDQIELEQLCVREYAPPLTKKGEAENACVPAPSDWYHGGAT